MTEEQRHLAIDFQNTFDTAHGKRVLAYIKLISGYDEGIDPKIVNAGMVMYFLGGREMYLRIKEQIDADTSEPVQQQEAVGETGVNKEGRQQEVAEDASSES